MKLPPEEETRTRTRTVVRPAQNNRLLIVCLCYKNIDHFYINPVTKALFCIRCCEFIPREFNGYFEKIKNWHSLIDHCRNEVKCGICAKLLLVYNRAFNCNEYTDRFVRGEYIIAQGLELSITLE